MTTLSIKDVPDQWAETLRQRAARNHRSLQGELMAILEAAVHAQAPVPARREPAFQGNAYPALGTALADRPRTKTIEKIFAEHVARFPKPITKGPLSTEIVRKDRDSR